MVARIPSRPSLPQHQSVEHRTYACEVDRRPGGARCRGSKHDIPCCTPSRGPMSDTVRPPHEVVAVRDTGGSPGCASLAQSEAPADSARAIGGDDDAKNVRGDDAGPRAPSSPERGSSDDKGQQASFSSQQQTTDKAVEKPLAAYAESSTWKHIGRGSFATVYRAHHKIEKDNVVAIKRVSRKSLSKKLLENIRLEIEILKTTEHPNIVRLYSTQTTRKDIFLIMEYCNAGDLSSLIKRAGPLLEEVTRKFVRQISSALELLHSMDIIHRDLKPQNLLLHFREATQNRKHEFILKMTDFGFARYLATESLADTMCGTPLYMAPEILTSKQYDGRADLWSLGAIIYECLTGKAPYPAKNYIELVEKYKAKTAITMPEVSVEMLDLLNRLLVMDPEGRMNHADLFAHPIVTDTADPAPKVSHSRRRTPSADHKRRSVTGDTAAVVSARDTDGVNVSGKGGAGLGGTDAERQGPKSRLSAGLEGTMKTDTQVQSRLSVALQETHAPWPEYAGPGSDQVRRPANKEDDFVVVDKPWAEVNQFADDMAARPSDDRSISLGPQRSRSGSIMSSSGSPSTSPMRGGIVSPYSAQMGGQSLTAGNPAFTSYVSTATARLFGQSPPTLYCTSQKMVPSMSGSQAPGPYIFKETVDDTTVVSLLKRYSQTIRILIDIADSDVRMLEASEIEPGPIYPPATSSSRKMSIGEEDVLSHSSSTTLASQTSLTQLNAYGGDQPSPAIRRQKALVLYLKGLSLMQGALDLVKTGMRNGSLSRSKRLNECVQNLRSLFNQCMDAAETLRHQGVVPDLAVNADLQMYEKALQFSKDAVLNEILGNNLQSDTRYRKARALLDGLLLFSQPQRAGGGTDGGDIYDTDAMVINNYLCGINERIRSLEMAKAEPKSL